MKTKIIVVSIVLSVFITKAEAQDSTKKDMNFILEYSVDPSHLLNPADIRGSIGLKFYNKNISNEVLLSYEYFPKTEDMVYKGVDASFICLITPKKYQKISAGAGARIGYVQNYGLSNGLFIKGEYNILKFLNVSGQAGFAGVDDWGWYPEGRLNIAFKF